MNKQELQAIAQRFSAPIYLEGEDETIVQALIAEIRRLRDIVSPSGCEDCIARNGCRCWDDD
jgi:hypothetical protein